MDGMRALQETEGTWNQETQIKVPVLPLTHCNLSFASYLTTDRACKRGKTIPTLFTLREDDIHESTTNTNRQSSRNCKK